MISIPKFFAVATLAATIALLTALVSGIAFTDVVLPDSEFLVLPAEEQLTTNPAPWLPGDPTA